MAIAIMPPRQSHDSLAPSFSSDAEKLNGLQKYIKVSEAGVTNAETTVRKLYNAETLPAGKSLSSNCTDLKTLVVQLSTVNTICQQSVSKHAALCSG